MGDVGLRELERRWRETGSVEDEAAWLLERVRVGEVSDDSLQLAAKAGHAASRASLGLPLVKDTETLLRESESFYDTGLRLRQEASSERVAEFGGDFARLLSQLESVLGEPGLSSKDLSLDHSGSYGEDMYCRGVVRLAAWKQRDGTILHLAIEHPDTELPVALVVGLRPWPQPAPQ